MLCAVRLCNKTSGPPFSAVIYLCFSFKKMQIYPFQILACLVLLQQTNTSSSLFFFAADLKKSSMLPKLRSRQIMTKELKFYHTHMHFHKNSWAPSALRVDDRAVRPSAVVLAAERADAVLSSLRPSLGIQAYLFIRALWCFNPHDRHTWTRFQHSVR